MTVKLKTLPCERCHGTGTVPDQKALGEEMRRLRKSAQVSLRDMADRLEISAPYLSDLERGNRIWSEERVEQFKGALRK